MKPDTCKHCPRYTHSIEKHEGIFPEGAKLLVITTAPDFTETEALQKAFIPLTGEDIEQVAFDYTYRCKSSTAMSAAQQLQAMIHCSQYDHVPEGITTITLVGPVPLAKYYPHLELKDWEGHILPEMEYIGDC